MACLVEYRNPRSLDLTDAERDVIRQLVREARQAEAGGEFDPRGLLGLNDRQRAAWRRRRRRWLKELFADDQRVQL